MSIQELRDKLDNAVDRNRIGWDLQRKIKLLPNPEARCPYCTEWFFTNRIWLVNDDSNYLIGCWNLDGTRLKATQIIHPHVWMSGEVCLGTLKAASEALFGGIDKGKHAHYVPRWLVQMGHMCDQIPLYSCPICQVTFFDDERVHFGYRNINLCPSPKCHEVARGFRCEGCMGLLELGQRRFCSPCESSLFIPCNICSVRGLEMEMYHYSVEGLRCCPKCFGGMRPCGECGIYHKREDLDAFRRCKPCIAEAPHRCSDCEARLDPEDLVAGVCIYCRNFCNECDCSPCECESEPYPYMEEEDETFVQ